MFLGLPVFCEYFSLTLKKSYRIYSSSASSKEINPVVKYTNADLDKINIFADNRKKAGIYRWINNTNGKTYVGSSTDINVRFYTYYNLRCLAKKPTLINLALLK